MKKVLLFSRDPGGANAIIPLVVPLQERGYDVRVFGKDSAVRRYGEAHVHGEDILGKIAAVTQESINAFLQKESPDFIITGTSADDFSEKFIWLAAESLMIPSIAVLDQWMNYGVRFSRFNVSRIAEYEWERTHPYLPTRITAIDEFAKSEMIAEGLPSERIVVCGQPYFETLFASRGDESAMESFCRRNEISPDDFVLVFASEPLSKVYGQETASLGYDERFIFMSFMNAVQEIAGHSPRRVVLVIRPHPKEEENNLLQIAERSAAVRWFVDNKSAAWTLMNRADLVCGMSSMFLIESVLLRRPTMSIQLGLRRPNPFVLDRRGILKSIVTVSDLREELGKFIMRGEKQALRFEVIRNPVERIIQEMETLICPS